MALRIVVLCGRAPRHIHVANRLCGAGDVVAVVQESRPPWTWRKLSRALRPGFVGRKLRRLLHGPADASEARFFFDGDAPALARPDLRVLVPDVNDPRVLSLVERADPDVVAVCGTSLIRTPLLGRGRLGMINLHPGIAPGYRGVDCAFWALLNGEPENVGATLHFIDDGIDTGVLLAHVRPEITPEDDDRSLLWKSVRDGAEAFAELMARLERGAPLGRTQEHRGRLYRAKERTPARERELRARLSAGLLAGRTIPPQVTWFERER